MEGSRLRMAHFKEIAARRMVNMACSRNCGELMSMEKTVNEMSVMRKIRKKALIM